MTVYHSTITGPTMQKRLRAVPKYEKTQWTGRSGNPLREWDDRAFRDECERVARSVQTKHPRSLVAHWTTLKTILTLVIDLVAVVAWAVVWIVVFSWWIED